MNASNAPDLTIANVGYTVGKTSLLTDISLTIDGGSWLSIIGPNGAGKTTLLRCLAGLTKHTGTISIGETANHSLSPSDRAKLVALVPQTPVVPPGVVVCDYVLLGRTPHQGLRYSASVRDSEAVDETLDRLDLHCLRSRRVDTLSGGERQRVVIARALVQEAPVLVLDEPTTGLDIGHQFDVLELISELRAERRLTVLSTLHDLPLAGQFSDRIALLAAGQLVATGSPAEVLTTEHLAEHYGVDADITHDQDGRLHLAVKRKQRS